MNIYIGMKFNRDKSKHSLAEQLENDLRAQLLEDARLLIEPTYPKIPQTNLTYVGPFYCESASDGASVTCTDCHDIVKAELRALDNCSLFVCYIDDFMSVGTIVELMYCAQKQIPTLIIYKVEDTKYYLKSKAWFAITAAQQINTKIKLRPVQNLTVNLLREAIYEFIKGETAIC